MTAAAPQHVSINGAKFVACREALVTRAYHDGQHEDGRPKFSIGFGSQTPPPQEGDTITVEEAFDRLRNDIREREGALNNALKVEVTQPQFDAVFSLYYQAGSRPLRTVAALFNAGKPILAMGAFMQFNSGADGIASDGHTKRRVREMFMGIDGYYGDLSQVAFFDGNPRTVARQMMPFLQDI